MTSLHEMFGLGSKDIIRVSLHRCDPAEFPTEPRCIVQFTFEGGSGQTVMMSSDDLKDFSKKLQKFTRRY